MPDGSSLELARAHRLRRTGELPHDLILFVALLRQVGVPVPVGGTLTAARALDRVGLGSRESVRAALRACLSASPGEAGLVDRMFSIFWSAAVPRLVESADGEAADPGTGRDEASAGDSSALQLSGRGRSEGEERARRARYSSSGRRAAPVAPLLWDAEEISRLARRLIRALARSRSRRLRSGHAGDQIDVRESLRHNLGHGDELLELRRLRERTDRARVAVLCDVSSSMQPFTPLFLTFMHALTRVSGAIEASIFNVELRSVTDVFRRCSLRDALAWLTAHSVALAGGTKTGHCLYGFNNEIARRGLVGPRTSALILSDGWDVGEQELLEAQLRRLRSQIGRLVWLDPHAAQAGYLPQVKGLKLALRYVDDYLDFSSPDSLRELVGRMEGSGGRSR